jgi:hypothetical protein
MAPRRRGHVPALPIVTAAVLTLTGCATTASDTENVADSMPVYNPPPTTYATTPPTASTTETVAPETVPPTSASPSPTQDDDVQYVVCIDRWTGEVVDPALCPAVDPQFDTLYGDDDDYDYGPYGMVVTPYPYYVGGFVPYNTTYINPKSAKQRKLYKLPAKNVAGTTIKSNVVGGGYGSQVGTGPGSQTRTGSGITTGGGSTVTGSGSTTGGGTGTSSNSGSTSSGS